MTNIPTEVFKAWLAGFFDGEGCITLNSAGSVMKNPRLALGQKNQLKLLTEIQQIYGGTICVHSSPGCHQWVLQAHPQVKQFLQDVLPFLRIKGAKAEIAIAICDAMANKEKKNRTTDEERSVRFALQEKFESLKEGATQ